MLNEATGDVILHFDDDDYYAPHYVRSDAFWLMCLSAL
eukprot:COSAG05_NODE_12912_length_449_cov_1.031429_2_plen_37_part_01